MPPVRTAHKRYPADWEVLEDKLAEFEEALRAVEDEQHEGRKKHELVWPVFRLHHERSRYIYDMYYRQKKISRRCYEFALREKFADKDLIAKWKKAGYEKLCCMQCINASGHAYNTKCICRVPKADLDEDKRETIECNHCGCRGCASTD